MIRRKPRSEKRMDCKCCENEVFAAHQEVSMDIYLDSDNNFLGYRPEDAKKAISAGTTPYGPYLW